MPLSTRDRQQIYTRLAPVIGEQEAETLLDQFPSTADAELVTVADLKAVESRLEKVIYKQMRTQTILMFTTIVAVLGLVSRTNLFG